MAVILVECPECKQSITSDLEQLGRECGCPQCKEAFILTPLDIVWDNIGTEIRNPEEDEVGH